MKFVLSVCALLVVGAVCAEDKYSSKYDNINLDEILSNERLYKKHLDCILDNGKCTPDGQELKDKIPDALKTECAKCNQKQKEGAQKVLRFLITKKPEDYKLLEEKYDPTGEYRKKYESKKEAVLAGKPLD